MRVSTLFGVTLRDVPSEAEIASHQLLLRAGYIRQLAAGIFSYLPLAQRSLSKISAILRNEIDSIGGQEVELPVVHPAEPWKRSGRWDSVDQTMVRFKDRRDHDMLLAMTHEEIVAELAATEIRSYRQLPQLIYQLQTKFRDEPRSRGGLIRVREFTMKDSYSLDRDVEGLRRQYEAHFQAYLRIGKRVGLALVPVLSDVGMMGGKVAHEFMYLNPVGEDTIVRCAWCGSAWNREVARFRKDAPAAASGAPMERIHTPGSKTIEDLSTHLGIPAAGTGKTVAFMATMPKERKLVIAVVRGDLDVNPILLQNLIGARGLEPATEKDMAAENVCAGFASPLGVDAARVIVVFDDSIGATSSLVMGANEPDTHVRNVQPGRDLPAGTVGNIAMAFDGAPCENCGGPLRMVRGIEVGNIFQLGTRYTESSGATYLDEAGKARPIVMGSYGIGVGRILGCVAEEHRDDRGLRLPISVAPFDVSLVLLGKEEQTRRRADALYLQLVESGTEVLYDDREMASGPKLVDSDLRGMPLRVVVSDRSLKTNAIEVVRRTESESHVVPFDDAATHISKHLSDLRAAFGTEVEPMTTRKEYP